MEFRRLRYFLRIAGDGSITRAAGVLRVAQPALSRQMKLLERELGFSLFTRSSQGIRLSPAGEQLRDVVAGPLRDLELALQSLKPDTGSDGVFTIGMPPNLCGFLGAPLVARLNQQSPNIRLRIVNGPMSGLIEWVSRGIIDFALLEGPSRHERLRERLLADLPLLFLGPATSPLSSMDDVPMDVALRQRLILPVHHLGLRSLIDGAALDMDIRLEIGVEVDSADAIRDLVGQGFGYTILPAVYAPCVSKSASRTWRLSDPAPRLSVVLASRRKNLGSLDLASATEEAMASIASDLLTIGPLA